MVRQKEDVVSTLKLSSFQGTGEITVRDILNGPGGLYGKSGVLTHTTMYPGSGIGYHVHDSEFKTCYIIGGIGTFSDNGKLAEIGPGGMTFTKDGEGHSIETTNGEPTEMTTLILYHNIAWRRNIHDYIIGICR